MYLDHYSCSLMVQAPEGFEELWIEASIGMARLSLSNLCGLVLHWSLGSFHSSLLLFGFCVSKMCFVCHGGLLSR
jgi:hypothetical protein